LLNAPVAAINTGQSPMSASSHARTNRRVSRKGLIAFDR
jgi:hypothetical protein